MSYHPVSAGHVAHEAPRNVTQEDIGELVARARAYLDSQDSWYAEALKVTAGIETTGHAAGFLAIHRTLRQHRRYGALGMFITALYNQCCSEHVISYPHDTPELICLGYSLPAEKVMLVQGAVGINCCWDMRGPVIVTGTTGFNMGCRSSGLLIIAGNVGIEVANEATGTVITPTERCLARSYCGTHVTHKQYAQNLSLKTYVDRLLEISKESPAMIEGEFGDGIKITEKINELVGGAK